MVTTRQEARDLLKEWVKSDSLRKHCLGVAYSMEAYAKKYELSDKEIDDYWICGLLHDFDWERHPTAEEHPMRGCDFLEDIGVDNEIVMAIRGHGNHTDVARVSGMAKTLFAVDELSGLILALAKVRPGNFEGMSAKSVKKALKKKDFAANVSRSDVQQGIEELGIKEDEIDLHYLLIINALAKNKEELGF